MSCQVIFGTFFKTFFSILKTSLAPKASNELALKNWVMNIEHVLQLHTFPLWTFSLRGGGFVRKVQCQCQCEVFGALYINYVSYKLQNP